MSNTTTWIFDLQDKLTGPIRKVQSTIANAMSGATKSISVVTQTEDKLNSSVRKLHTELDTAKVKLSNSFSTSPIRNVTNEVQRLEKELNDVGNINLGGITPQSSAISGIKNLIGGIFVASAVESFTSSVVDLTGEFQKYEAVLTNSFGSAEKARASMEMLQKFASTTPFQLNELTDSYVKLVNRGFEPTREELTKLGDLASSTAKPFDQLTEAVLDAQMGEFERLKEFGIKAKVQGDKVTLSFKDQVKEISNTPTALKQALLSFGDMDGVKGSMGAMMNTLPGAISNLKDSWNAFKVSLGMGESPFLISLIQRLKQFVDFLTAHKELIISVFKGIAVGIAGASIALTAFTAYTAISNLVAIGFTGTMAMLNAVVMANPFVFIAAGIAIAVTALIMAWNKFEGFRKFVMGLWGSIKAVFGAMWDVVKNFFGGLADMISALINRDWDGLKAGASKFGKGLMGANPVGFVAQYGDDIKQGWQDGKEKGAASFKKSQEEKQAKSVADLTTTNKPLVSVPMPSGKKNQETNGIATQTGNRNVVVTINGGIAPNLTIVSNSVSEGAAKLKQIVADALIGAVHDSEIAFSNG